MNTTFSRLILLRRAFGALVAAALAPPLAWGRARRFPPVLRELSVTADGGGFDGDSPLLATVKSSVAGAEPAYVEFVLDEPATVTTQALRTGIRSDLEVWREVVRLSAGRHRLAWQPDPATPPGTYLMRISAKGPTGTRTYGRRPPRSRAYRAPVVRVLGVEAAFTRRSYTPGQLATLRVAAAASTLTIEFFQTGPEAVSTNRSDELSGVPFGSPVVLDWSGKSDRAREVYLRTGSWPTGVYFARLTCEDGRVGFAPFVLRPTRLGQSRVAAIVPTNTWQAYNYRDEDGDGWGDTWYIGGSPPVRLERPFLDRGVPPRFKHHDRAFLQWVARTGKTVDFYADDDLEQFESGDVLRFLYDLIVFPGHSEYMTTEAYDNVTRFRDLGGNLLFLSANNFFWCVRKREGAIKREELWRNLGRPEGMLIGTQYRANDDGTTQKPFVVRNAAAAPWLWEGTDLVEGSTFGDLIGGFGTEIDAVTPLSPPGTIVVAEIPDIFGPGRTAQMTYYETEAGARVFAAGVLDFGGSVMFQPMRHILENVWARLARP